jgi:hypothetical protein
MAPESSFTGFGDTYTGTVAPDWDMVSILSVLLSILVLTVQGLYLPHLSAFEGDPFSRGIFRPPLPPQLPSYPTSGFDIFFPEIPMDTSSALGVTQDIFPFNQVPHEASAFQPQTTATSPYTTTSYHEVAAAEVWHTGPTHSSSSVLPIFPLVCFARCFFFFSKSFLISKTNSASPILAPGYRLPTKLDQGATEDLQKQAMELQTVESHFLQRGRPSRGQYGRSAPQGVCGS